MTELIETETMVPSGDPGIALYVRNKRPADMTVFTPERTVLFVHGATYPAETAFDLRLDGVSWMEFIARRGFDVYLLDVRGYGRSTRPPQMDASAAANAPFADTATARRDVDAAMQYICQVRGVQRVVLIGWSWGCAIMGSYAAQYPEKVAKLVLFAPGWLRDTASPTDQGGALGAWRAVTREAAKVRWLNGVPADKRDALIPVGWFEAWVDATFGTAPELRAPNGVVQDSRDYWTAGRPLYDPARITAPVFIVVGEWDHDTPPSMAQALFARITNAPQKQLVLIGEATHTMLMERNRMILFEQVGLFLQS